MDAGFGMASNVWFLWNLGEKISSSLSLSMGKMKEKYRVLFSGASLDLGVLFVFG